jgi:hypothetical protein
MRKGGDFVAKPITTPGTRHDGDASGQRIFDPINRRFHAEKE